MLGRAAELPFGRHAFTCWQIAQHKVLVTRVKQDTNKSNHALTVHISLSGLCVERLVDFSIGVAVRGDLRLRLQLVDTYQPIV